MVQGHMEHFLSLQVTEAKQALDSCRAGGYKSLYHEARHQFYTIKYPAYVVILSYEIHSEIFLSQLALRDLTHGSSGYFGPSLT